MTKSVKIKKIVETAQNGDNQAQLELGKAYHSGKFLEKNDVLAIYWLFKSARQGNEFATKYLKTKFPQKVFRYRPISLLINWWNKANNGNIEAQLKLGLIYLHELNDDLPMYAYSKFYKIPVDKVEAEFWLEKAHLKLNREATHYLAKMKLETGEWQTAIELFTEAAISEFPKSQLQLGSMYYEGSYFDQDYEKAFYWLTKSGNNGEPIAANILFKSYLEGIGVAKDYDIAIFWLTKAATLDKIYYSDFFTVSMVYYEGIDTKVDYKKAQLYLSIAAEKEYRYDRRAKFFLGSELLIGERFPKDVKRGLSLLSETGPDGWELIGKSYWFGDYLEKNKDRGLYWMIKANTYYKELSAETLCSIKKTGNLKSLDNPDILRLWKLATNNDASAKYEIARYYENNRLIDDLDYYFLVSLYEDAASQNHTEAQYEAARINFSGVLGDESSIEKAIVWCENAANNNHVLAQYEIAIYYLYNKDIHLEDDRRKGFDWLKKAAENDNYNAMVKLAELYKNGLRGDTNRFKIIRINKEMALYWQEKASSYKNNG